jgi:transcriptional regulator with XRE-family HTH domain
MEWVEVTKDLAAACVQIGTNRISKGQSQKDLAQQLKMPQPMLSRIERCDLGGLVSKDTWADIQRAANVVGVTLPPPVEGKIHRSRTKKLESRPITVEAPAPASASAPAPESLPPGLPDMTRRILEAVAAGSVTPEAASVTLATLRRL